jgi:hypothetical protein
VASTPRKITGVDVVPAVFDVVSAVDAFRKITGKSPTDSDAQDAWKVFFEAARSVVEPTQERAAWVSGCVRPWKASAGLLKARVRPALVALGNRSPDSIRHVLSEFDPAFGRLTDEHVHRALKARGWYKTIALLALPVRAMGVKPNARKTEGENLKRIANAFREAERKRRS